MLAPLGACMQYMAEGLDGVPRTFTILAVVNAAMLAGTTLIAFAFALRRRIAMHRMWMTRSYAVALVFFEGRFVLGVTGLETAGVEMAQAVIWSCLALSLLAADVVNDWYEIQMAASAPSRVVPADRPPRAAVAPTV